MLCSLGNSSKDRMSSQLNALSAGLAAEVVTRVTGVCVSLLAPAPRSLHALQLLWVSSHPHQALHCAASAWQPTDYGLNLDPKIPCWPDVAGAGRFVPIMGRLTQTIFSVPAAQEPPEHGLRPLYTLQARTPLVLSLCPPSFLSSHLPSKPN